MDPWQPNWKTSLLPGLSITGFVILARLLGVLQPLEWKVFDLSLRWRPAEPTDPRITIVAITEDDIQTALEYPISDRTLANLVQTIQTYQPRVVGIDIFRDKPVGEGYTELAETLASFDNVVGIHKIDDRSPVKPPPMLSGDNLGFADAILDNDGFLRRSLLGESDSHGDYQFSFTIQLVRQYLASANIQLENGLRDPETMRFGSAEIPRFQANTGGYVRTDRGGNQTLINFRSGPYPFERVTYKTLVSGQANPELLNDRLILIGYTAESIKDFISSGAIPGVSPSLVPGIDAQAHAISQILSAVIDQRPFLHSFPDALDYLLILGSGLLGLGLAHWQRKPLVHLWIVAGVGGITLLLCYGLLIASWWVPVVPMVAAFVLNGLLLYPFYQAQAQLRSQLNERQTLINQTFTTIHNGPLQTLAQVLSHWPPEQLDILQTDLQTLNQELRDIYDAMRQEMLLPTQQLVLSGQQAIDLQMPLDELLREAYQITLERHRSFFEPILKIVSFESMDDQQLTPDHKRALGRFLEEALLNVHKYAKTTTRLTVECRQKDGYNIIRVIDNGEGLKDTTHSGYGTKQSQELARHLNGEFKRVAGTSKGVRCELHWPVQQQPSWQQFLPRRLIPGA